MKRVLQYLSIFLLVVIQNTIHAQTTRTSVATGNWSNAVTWSPSGVPAAGDTIIIALGHTVTLTSATNIGSGNLTVTGTIALAGFNLTAGSLSGAGSIGSASGSPLVTVGSNGSNTTYSGIFSGAGARLTKEGTGTLTLSGANTYTGATTISTGTIQLGASEVLPDASALTVTGTLDLNGYNETISSLAGAGLVTTNVAGSVTLTHGGNGSTTFSGIIQNGNGTLALTKAGTGTLTLSGSNTYTGITTINAGAISIAADNNLGAAPVSATAGQLVLNGGTLATTGTFSLNANRGISLVNSGGTISPGTALTYGGIIAGTGGLIKAGAGTLTLSGSNTYTGITTINAGAISISADNNLGAAPVSATAGQLVLNGGTLLSSADVTLSSNRGITLGSSGGIFNNAASTTLTYGGIISGTGVFTKATGTGTLILSGANTYSGSTSINAGTLTLGASEVIPDASALTIGTGTILNLNSYNETVGSLAGAGSVTSSTAGTLTLTVGGNNSTTTYSGVMQNGSATSVSLTKVGTGTLTLSGSNTYTGITTINAGAISIAADNNLGTAPVSATAGQLVLNGGTLLSSANVTLSSNRGITLGSSGGIFNTAASTTLTYGGIISGTGALTKATGTGTLILSGANTYSGITTINAGAISISADNNLGAAPVSATAGQLVLNGGTLLSSADVTLSSNRGITLGSSGGIFNTAASTTLTYGGIISGTGALTKATGTGTLILSGANTYSGSTSINAGTLTLGASEVIPNGSTLTVASTFDLNGFSETVGPLVGAGLVTSSTAGTSILTVVTTVFTVFSGVIQNGLATSVSFTKAGTGTLYLTGANSYTGVTTISAGTLSIGFGGGTTGSVAGSITNNASLVFDRSNDLTYSGVISGTGSLTKIGQGILTLSGANTYTGSTNISAGTLTLGASGVIPDASALTISTGTILNLNSYNETVGSLAGAGSVTSSTAGTLTLTVGGNNSTTTYSGVMQNGSATSVSLTKVGTGTLTLSGSNTYTGITTINAGAISIAADNNLGTAPVTTTAGQLMLNGGTLVTTGTFSLNANRGISLGNSGGTISPGTALTYGGIIAGTGALIKAGAGTLTLAGTNTYSGTTTISAGTLSIGSGGTSGEIAGNILNNASLIVNRSDNLTYADVISGTGTLTKQGAGVFTLTGTNTYTGATTISAGALSIGNGGTSGVVAGSITNNASLIINRSDNLTYAGVISGTGSLTKEGSGVFTISGANTYTGATTINAGTLQLGVASERISNSSALTIASGANFDMGGFSETIGSIAGAGTVTSSATGALTLSVGGNNSSTTFSGIIQNGSATSIALTKTGTGTLTFDGSNTYTGATTISSGTLAIGNASALSASNVTLSGTGILRTDVSAALKQITVSASTAKINCNGNNSTCTRLIFISTTQPSGTYGSTSSSATYKNDSYFTSSATGVLDNTDCSVSSASSSPSLCVNSLLVITHSTTGATGIGTPTGLPSGVTASWASNTITISGTPTASGTFNYSISLIGSCGSNIATGTITVIECPMYYGGNGKGDAYASGTENTYLTDKLFTGNTSIDFSLGANWAGGTFPNAETGIVPPTATQQPVLSGSQTIAAGTTINILSGASLTIAPTGVLNVNGTLNNSGTLTLQSNATGSASIGNSSGTITGIAHVERYVPARRAWRLMTAPQTSTATIFETWQNRGVFTPGWGTLVTGPNPTGPGGNGLDVSPMNNVSLRRWNASTQAFSNITNTHVPVSAGSAGSGDNTGYFIFVRGDRNPANVFVPNTNITTLRTTGRLQTGNQSFTCANRRGQFTLIGNPYASPVDMNQVARTNLLKRIYVWDPRVNQVGAYVMLDDLDNDGVWTKSLLASQQTQHIQSTQAFFVETQNDATASIRFQENFKSTFNNNEAFRPAGISSSSASQQDAQTGDAGESNVPASLTPALYTTLYLTDAQGTRELADGNVAEFHAMFADSVNLEDAVKLTNQNETLGLFRNGVSLTAERRQPLQVTDTLFFRLSCTSVRTYQLEFNPFNMPAGPLQGILVDRFLQTQTLISLQVPTRVDFQVTDQAASAASDRFFLIFRPITIVPVDFLRITASPVSERNIQVQWDIEQERQVAHYEVERSVDGRLFRKIGQVTARGGFTGRMSYTFLDEGLHAGNYFYRIQSVDVDGRRGVSPIAQAKLGGTIGSGISLYPNPVEGNQLNIQWTGMKSSTVQVSIVAANGQRVYTNVVSLAAAQGATVIRPSLVLPAGTYWLEWQTDANTVLREAFVVQ